MNQQQRSVVQQALEALEVVWREHKAIDGLRQLLEAEPLMEPEGKCKECLTYNGHQEGCSHTPSPAQPADHADELTIAYLDGVHTGKQLAKRECVGLTIDELIDLEGKHRSHEDLSAALKAKLREKNVGDCK